jgi:hypothetical protein
MVLAFFVKEAGTLSEVKCHIDRHENYPNIKRLALSFSISATNLWILKQATITSHHTLHWNTKLCQVLREAKSVVIIEKKGTDSHELLTKGGVECFSTDQQHFAATN